MPAWTLDWNSLTNDQREVIVRAAEFHVCPCCGSAGQMALDIFNATIAVIEDRDRRETSATLACSKATGGET